MTFDEFYFHHKRGLGKWESIGHPIDSIFFFAVFIFCILFSYSESLNIAFITLSIFSTLIITKDEWVHTEQSSAKENWLHAMLFIIHPLALIGLYYAWRFGFSKIILIQAVIISLFTVYQILYWNILKKEGRYETRS